MKTLEQLPFHLEERAVTIKRQERNLLLLAAAFILINASAYILVISNNAPISLSLLTKHLVPPVVWALVFTIVHGMLNRYQPIRDPLFIPIVALLTGWGLILIDRLAPAFLIRQTMWIIVGMAVMLVLIFWPKPRSGDPSGLRWLRRYRYTWLIVGLVLLGLTLVWGVNPSGSGLELWLGLKIPFLGGVYFQPSELLKLLAVAFLASYMAEKRGLIQIKMASWGKIKIAMPPLAYLAPLLVMWGLSLVLLIWQRDLGAATLFFTVFLVMVFLASGRWESWASGLVLLAGMVAIAFFFPISQLEIARLRIRTWLNPWPDAQGSAFQIVQSLLALAAGGVIGQGVGQGFPTYVPVVHSDFSIAAVAEEWGLIGTLVVLICLAVLIYRGLEMAVLSAQPFVCFLSAGISAFLGVQSLIILGGIVRFFPLTGVTLPFLSYGGSSLLVSSMMVGLLVKISGVVKRRI
ncbi:MAG: FtsW/RodA/SpoVE family cell cycle protein [Anaerolineales bacterium]|nr:FtsW/RodA/SpoVE family cell cycle protein [Anaerolineales bacterium]